MLLTGFHLTALAVDVVVPAVSYGLASFFACEFGDLCRFGTGVEELGVCVCFAPEVTRPSAGDGTLRTPRRLATGMTQRPKGQPHAAARLGRFLLSSSFLVASFCRLPSWSLPSVVFLLGRFLLSSWSLRSSSFLLSVHAEVTRGCP